MARYSYVLLSFLIILSSCRGTPFDTCGDPPRAGDHTPIYLRILDQTGKDVLTDSTYVLEDIDIVKNCDPAAYEEIKIVTGNINGSGEQVLLIAIDNHSYCYTNTIHWKDGGTTTFETDYDRKDVSKGRCPSYEYTRYLTQNGARVEKLRDIKSGADYLDYYVIHK
jgi:hypothetical protein